MVNPKEDLTGQTFGVLKVIGRGEDYTPPSGKSRASWICQCVCGRELRLGASKIRDPKYACCVHIKKPSKATRTKTKASMHVGDTFGELEIIARAPDHFTPSGIKKPQWLCRCSCGREVVIQQQRLALNEKMHCGCLRSKLRTKSKPIEYDLSGDFGIGYTSKDEPFWFDLEDYDKVRQYHWYYSKRGYVTANTRKPDGKPTTICLHQVVMGQPPAGYITDHIDHPPGINAYKVDNRKQNLRFVTVQENSQNRNLRRDNKTGYTGIQKCKSNGKFIYHATITFNGKTYSKDFPIDRLDDAIKWRVGMEKSLFDEFRCTSSSSENEFADILPMHLQAYMNDMGIDDIDP